MRRSLLAGALACSFLASPSQAAEGCISIDKATTALQESGAKYAVLSGSDKSRAVALYNSTPPKTDTAYDVAILVVLPDGSAVLAVGMGIELCDHMAIRPMDLEEVLTAIYGART